MADGICNCLPYIVVAPSNATAPFYVKFRYSSSEYFLEILLFDELRVMRGDTGFIGDVALCLHMQIVFFTKTRNFAHHR